MLLAYRALAQSKYNLCYNLGCFVVILNEEQKCFLINSIFKPVYVVS